MELLRRFMSGKEEIKPIGEEPGGIAVVESGLGEYPIMREKELVFHESKAVIESELEKRKKILGERDYPEVKFYMDKDRSSVEFDVPKSTDFFALINIITEHLGACEIDTFIGSIRLRSKEFSVDLNNRYDPSVKFSRAKNFKSEEIETILETYFAAVPDNESQSDPVVELNSLGVAVFSKEGSVGWESLAGYEKAKELVKETIIYPLEHGEIYDEIAHKTRKNYETNRPRAVLFAGPPGTGKTTMARIIAGEVNASLIYVPVESIMTKWYGESERNLAMIFEEAARLGDCLIFLDEIDSLATSRDNDINEATRRVLSVLLREIDGFEVCKKTMVIGATNRKDDLDPALLSRFDTKIEFELPNTAERKAIFGTYAKQLGAEELETLAGKSEGLSGRDIRKLCEGTERSWALALINEEVEKGQLPDSSNYLARLNRESLAK